MIKMRQLGRTGLNVSEIGFGAWAIGGRAYGDVEEKDAIETIEAYVEAGGNLIDTARGYAQSEKYIGKILSGGVDRSKLVLITKTTSTDSPEKVPAMWRDLETSLTQMKTDYVDVYMMHHPSEDPHTLELVSQEMEKMKEQGLIRHTAASIKGPLVTGETSAMCRQYIAHGGVDVFEVIYSILRQQLAEDGVFGECRTSGVGLVIRTVLESGFLTGKYPVGHRFPKTDHRHRWSESSLDAILEAAASLTRLAADEHPEPFSLSALSIRFALANPDVSTVIIGAKNAEQLKDNLRVARMPELPADLLERLLAFGRGRTSHYNL